MSNLVNISEEIKFLSENIVEIGILGEDAERKPEKNGVAKATTILEYAVYNEFGTKHIPARPFMRTAIEESSQTIQKTIERCIQKILQGKMTGYVALKIMGETIRGLIIKSIQDAKNWATPLNSETVKQKLKRGANNTDTLLEDRFLIRSIRYKVTNKRGVVLFISDFKEV